VEEARKHSVIARACAAWLLLLAGCAASGGDRHGGREVDPRDEAAIRATLAAQTKSWNEGDLPGFVRGYAESERMSFVGSKGEIVHGRAALLARYQRNYSGKMGTLTFGDVDVRRVGPDAYVVLGKWALARPPDDPHGVFTLVFERGPEGLQIVHDHSSGAE